MLELYDFKLLQCQPAIIKQHQNYVITSIRSSRDVLLLQPRKKDIPARKTCQDVNPNKDVLHFNPCVYIFVCVWQQSGQTGIFWHLKSTFRPNGCGFHSLHLCVSVHVCILVESVLH